MSFNFEAALLRHGLEPLRRGPTATLQINVGKLCNQACLHCHVDAGPKRTEIMTEAVAERLLELLEATPSIMHVDITGGAPELNPNFRRLVGRSRELGRAVIDRMKAMPTDDDCFGAGKIRPDGRALHPVYLMEAKKPSESRHSWDVAKIITTTPMDEAFRPMSEGGCPLIKA